MALLRFWSCFPAGAVAVLCLVLFMAVDAQTTTGIMSIKSNLPYPVRILCSSDVETLPYHDTAAGDVFQFNFDVTKQSSWSCTFQSEDKDGTFLMWQRPDRSGLCDHVCPWKVDVSGLSLQRSSGNLVVIYFWR